MKNREKFAKEIMDIACSGNRIAFEKGKGLCACAGTSCAKCIFNHYSKSCVELVKEWCESEYKATKITIPENTTVDTKIIVSMDGDTWVNNHFAGFSKDGLVLTWMYGATSWSFSGCDFDFVTIQWPYAKLASEENNDQQ